MSQTFMTHYFIPALIYVLKVIDYTCGSIFCLKFTCIRGNNLSENPLLYPFVRQVVLCYQTFLTLKAVSIPIFSSAEFSFKHAHWKIQICMHRRKFHSGSYVHSGKIKRWKTDVKGRNHLFGQIINFDVKLG